MYERDGTESQYRVWIEHADRQLQVLRRQRDELNDTIRDLKALRDETEVSLKDRGAL